MMLIGMSKRQRRRLVLAEGGVIAAAALAGGLAAGMVLLKLFLTVAGIVVGSDFGFYLPIAGACVTMAVFIPLFAAASLLGLRSISRKSVIELLHADARDEKTPRLALSGIAAAVCALVAVAAFPLASRETGIAANLLVLGGAAASLTCASLFVMQGAIAAKRAIARKSGAYYRGTNLLKAALFDNSTRSNLQSMTLSAVLYTAAFLSVAVLVAISGNAAQTARQIMPYALSYTAWSNNAPESEHVESIRAAVSNEPGFTEADFSLIWADRQSFIAVMSESDYDRIAGMLGEASADLGDAEVLSVSSGMREATGALPSAIADAARNEGRELTIAKTSNAAVTVEGLVSELFVLTDDDVSALFADAPAQRIYAFDYDTWTEKSVADGLEGMTSSIENGDVAVTEANSYYVSDKTQFGMMLYLAGFVSIVFILAIASFSYSRLHARSGIEGERFAAIAKLGLSRKELSRICVSHAATLLLMPFALAIVYF
ncbi:MAG: FtsX-like permease family protein [Slackia piriformis]|nr:FtsX-like permease family protein [Slackia piriformis]MDO5023422.1 FtsX-like permease family protein [Slackia piriformis]